MTEATEKRKLPRGLAMIDGKLYIRWADRSGHIATERVASVRSGITLLVVRKNERLDGKVRVKECRAVTFAEIAKDALAYSLEHKRSYRSDASMMERLVEWFGAREADSLRVPEIETVLKAQEEAEGWAASTYNHYRSLLSMTYREALRAGKVITNPVRAVRHRKEDNNRVRELSHAEEIRLRAVVAEFWAEHMPELDLALHTGLRLGNVYGLTWEMVDWSARMLHVPLTKNGKPLHVPLNADALSALRGLVAKGTGTGRVFISSKTGEPLEGGRHWFKKALAKAGVENFHWHDWRHTFCSRLAQAGLPLNQIADLMGHSSLAMTRRYAHLQPTQLHEAVALLEAKPKRIGESKTESMPLAHVGEPIQVMVN